MARWQLLSNHGFALWCVARDSGMTLRQIGDCVGVTERTAHGIVNDLVESGYLKRYHQGNRNRYEVQRDMPLRPPVSGHKIGEIIDILRDGQADDKTTDEPSLGKEVRQDAIG